MKKLIECIALSLVASAGFSLGKVNINNELGSLYSAYPIYAVCVHADGLNSYSSSPVHITNQREMDTFESSCPAKDKVDFSFQGQVDTNICRNLHLTASQLSTEMVELVPEGCKVEQL